jgi:hypothetical protein
MLLIHSCALLSMVKQTLNSSIRVFFVMSMLRILGLTCCLVNSCCSCAELGFWLLLQTGCTVFEIGRDRNPTGREAQLTVDCLSRRISWLQETTSNLIAVRTRFCSQDQVLQSGPGFAPHDIPSILRGNLFKYTCISHLHKKESIP